MEYAKENQMTSTCGIFYQRLTHFILPNLWNEMKWYEMIVVWNVFNPFVPNAPFVYLLKTSENLKAFLNSLISLIFPSFKKLQLFKGERQYHGFGVFIEYISYIVLVFLLLTLKKKMPLGYSTLINKRYLPQEKKGYVRYLKDGSNLILLNFLLRQRNFPFPED